MRNVMSFFSEAIFVLLEMSNGTANSVNNASSIYDSLEGFNIDNVAANFSADTVGINTDEAVTNFNISVDDIDIVMQDTKENLKNDPLLSGIGNLTNDAKTVLSNQTKDAEVINIINHWVLAMENATYDYFSNESCASFLDCSHFAVFQLYGLFDAENLTNMSKSQNAISLFEDYILNLLGNTSYTVVEVYSRATEMQRLIEEIKNNDVFCSEPPKMLSQLKNYNVTVGSTLQLFCNVSGNPKPHVWWFRNDELLRNQTDQLLVLHNVTHLDESKYHCVAGNFIANLTLEYAYILVNERTIGENTTNNKADENEFLEDNAKESEDVGSLMISLGTTFGVLLFIFVIGVGFAARLYVRKRSRTKRGLSAITSLNMVRPSGSKPKFNANLVTFEASLD